MGIIKILFVISCNQSNQKRYFLQDTVNILFGTNITSEDDMENWLKKKRPTYDHVPRNGEEMSLSRVGKDLYEKAGTIHIRNSTDHGR